MRKFILPILLFGLSAIADTPPALLKTTTPLVKTGNTLSIPFATSSVDGYLKAADWTNFNNKSTLPSQSGQSGKFLTTNGSAPSWGLVTSGVADVTASPPLSSSGGATPNISCQIASGSLSGCLSTSDWTTFNSKQATLSFTAPLSNSSNTVSIPPASASANGYLSSADWSTFNSKEPAITTSTTNKYWRGDKSFQVLDTLAVPENTNLYYTQARFDSAFTAKSTTNLTEGTNLYYTQGRFDTAFAAKTTANLTELTNLYYTQARFDSAFSAKSTTNLTEGTNLYYTDARVQTLAKNQTPAQEFYVTKDNGNDANDCSRFKPCKTIQAGITAANAVSAYFKQTIVHVAPASGGTGSSYNENITFSQQGVNLVCNTDHASGRACLISGSVTVNMTGTTGTPNFVAASNESYMSGFVVTTTGTADSITFSGTLFQRFILTNSYIDNNGTGSAVVMSNSGITGSTKSTFISYDSTFNSANATNPTISLQDGRFWAFGTQPTIQNNTATNKAVIQSGAATSFVCNLCAIQGQVQVTNNTANATLNLSTVTSGSAACLDTPATPSTGIITLAYFGCTSTATNSVTGSGVVFSTPGSVRLSTSGDIISTVTQAVVPGFPQGEMQLGAGAITGTNVLLSMKGGHIKMAQTTAPTAVVNANAGTSATCTLTNGTDGGGILNLTEGSAAWASGTQCTVTFNKAYGVAPICTFSPNNAAAASHAVTQQVNFTTTTSTMLVSFGAAESAATAYKWMFHCMETQ